MGATRLANRFAETGDVKIYMTIDKVTEQTSPTIGAGSQGPSDPPEELSATNRKILDWYVACMTQPKAPDAGSEDEGDQS
jgi:hypothetical protein